MISQLIDLHRQLEESRADMDRMREAIRIDSRLIGRLNAELNKLPRNPDERKM
jgi:hypothetical protein